MQEHSKLLRKDVLEWREKKALQVMGVVALRTYGAKYILADCIVDDIIYCCQAGKITKPEHLVTEASHYLDAYLDEVFALIVARYPTTAPVTPASKAKPTPTPNDQINSLPTSSTVTSHSKPQPSAGSNVGSEETQTSNRKWREAESNLWKVWWLWTLP